MSLNYGFALPALAPNGAGGNNPFGQLGPTLDLSFGGTVTDANNPNGYTLFTDFITPQYQVASTYAIWETNVGLVSKNFSDIITFTRADATTCASYVDNTGTIQLATANTPRFDYDPVALTLKGILIEEARTNIVLQSTTFTTTWTPSANVTYSRTLSAPDGTSTATSLVEDTATATRVTQQPVTSTGSNTHTFTIYAKVTGTGSQRWLGIRLANDASPGVNYFQAVFDINAGTAGSLFSAGDGTITSATVVNAGNGWYRATIVGIPSTSATAVQVRVSLSNNSTNVAPSYLGDGVSGLILWGAQLEVGGFATSYIPTTTTAVTRATDSAVITTLSPWYNSSEGTLFAQVIANNYANAGAQVRVFAELNDGTNSNTIRFGRGATNAIRFQQTSGGIQQVITPSLAIAFGTITNGQSDKFANGYSSTIPSLVLNGTKATDITAGWSVVPGMTVLRLGGTVTGSALFNLNGHIQRITYYPRRLSNTDLIALTT